VIKIDTDKKENQFTEEQINLIQETLDISIQGDDRIPKKILFEAINERVPLEMEQYQFEYLLTRAIRSGTVRGYEVRQGRGGGVCKAGAFKEKDAKRKKSVSVTFNGRTLSVPDSKRKLLASLLSEASEGEGGNGNLFVNNRLYSIPEKIDTLTFLEKYLTGK